ncbi:MAG: hypothetical protein ACRD45_05265 [Bryobacteraceae bacterium]
MTRTLRFIASFDSFLSAQIGRRLNRLSDCLFHPSGRFGAGHEGRFAGEAAQSLVRVFAVIRLGRHLSGKAWIGDLALIVIGFRALRFRVDASRALWRFCIEQG